MPESLRPRPGLDVAATAARIGGYASILQRFTLLLADWVCAVPELEVKILFGEHLYADARHTGALRRRLVELASYPEALAPEDRPDLVPVSAASRLDDTPARLHAGYRVVKRRLLDEVRDHVATTHPLWDEPTVVVLSALAADLERQLAEAEAALDEMRELFHLEVDDNQLAAAWDEALRATRPGDPLRRATGDSPARDSRFTMVGSAPPPPVGRPDTTGPYLHGLLMSIEIPTIEHCGRLVADFPELPWEFVEDMGRQAWDESRHARMCLERMRQLGVKPGQVPIDRQLWDVTSGLPAVLRLAVHQRTGEWLGVDGAVLNAARVDEAGDDVTARMFDYLMRDEITHVAFGNKWIRHLAGSAEQVREVQQAALAHRAQFGETVNGGPGLPVNRWACERAGFSEPEIEDLLLARGRG